MITVRRDVSDAIENLMTGSMITNNGLKGTLNVSGSRREGFRFWESDFDMMSTVENLKVIWNVFQVLHYIHDFSIFQVFVFDGSNSPPGYGLLQGFKLSKPDNYLNCVINGKVYLSSSNSTRFASLINPDLWIHGPCIATNMPYFVFDRVTSIKSDFWPPVASSFVSRCKSWPEPCILKEIVKNGCHLVPIGHKLGIHEKEEWRISFAVAEKRLVLSMNHSQFLLYGLMKLFLKEVINKDVEEYDELLCSYHMKTAIFWVLQQNSLPECNSQSFLQCFWIRFKLVIKWVYEGDCPNFFIPENNLFMVKIRGSAQNKLFCKLYAMYEKGVSCIFECPTIVDNSYKSLNTNPKKINPLIKELVMGIDGIALSLLNLKICVKTLSNVEKLINFNLARVYALVIQKATAAIFHQMAFYLLSFFGNNKLFYRANKLSVSVIKLSVKFGSVSDLLFNAMYLYRKRNIHKALTILERAKIMLKQLDMVHLGHLITGSHAGTNTWLKKSLSYVELKNYGFSVHLYNTNFYIDELVTEQQHSLRTPSGFLNLPSLVFFHILEFLCYRTVNTQRAQTALNDLYELLENKQDIYTFLPGRDISWHMLGKFQEMSGNFQMALYAYRKSLDEIGINRISTATEERIKIVESQMRVYEKPSR